MDDAVAYEIDVPDVNNLSGAWINVATFKTKAEAVEWIRENIAPCDDEGRISFISEIYS